jgi:predicted nucleotidyltransferase
MAAKAARLDLERLAEICERFGVAELSLFGSAARGDDRPSSDVDVLYVLRPGARLGWRIEKLSDELSELFGRPVDLVSKRALHPRIRDDVLAEARPLYEAA